MNINNILTKLRNNINILDKQLLILLSQRKQLAINIARTKIINNYPVKDKTREKLLLDNLTLIGKKYHLNETYIKKIFNIIIENSVSIQEKWINENLHQPFISANFSFLGSIGSYSYLAVQKFAKKKFDFFTENGCKTFDDIINRVETNQSDYAILPIENSSSGFIPETYTILANTKLTIIGEIHIPINHCIIAHKSTQLLEIKKIYSHIQPFKQCSKFIKYFPNWKLKTTKSTTEAIQQLKCKHTHSIAAIASQENEKLHKLQIISKNISNKKNNITRFIILTKTSNNLSLDTKTMTTIMIIINNNHNFIQKIKNLFIMNNIVIKRLVPHCLSEQSKTILIFIDIQNHINNDKTKKVLLYLKKITNNLKILGCYPIDQLTL